MTRQWHPGIDFSETTAAQRRLNAAIAAAAACLHHLGSLRQPGILADMRKPGTPAQSLPAQAKTTR